MKDGFGRYKQELLLLNLLLYASVTMSVGERIRSVIEDMVPRVNIEVLQMIDGLSARLLQPEDDASVAVLVAASREEIFDFLSLSHLFRDIRIILILPDRSPETIALAHRLRPNFLSYADSDFKEIAAVLNKILEVNK